MFKGLYDQGYERWDHSAFLLNLEKINSTAPIGGVFRRRLHWTYPTKEETDNILVQLPE